MDHESSLDKIAILEDKVSGLYHHFSVVEGQVEYLEAKASFYEAKLAGLEDPCCGGWVGR